MKPQVYILITYLFIYLSPSLNSYSLVATDADFYTCHVARPLSSIRELIKHSEIRASETRSTASFDAMFFDQDPLVSSVPIAPRPNLAHKSRMVNRLVCIACFVETEMNILLSLFLFFS